MKGGGAGLRNVLINRFALGKIEILQIKGAKFAAKSVHVATRKEPKPLFFFFSACRMETIEEFPRTPEREDCVKRLFGDAGEGANTSEYFSQSSQENGGSFSSNQPFSSPDPVQVCHRTHTQTLPTTPVHWCYPNMLCQNAHCLFCVQGWSISFATPRHSPHHNSFSSMESSSMCESPPLKQPRLFTPPPPSPTRKQHQTSHNSPLNFELSPTPTNPTPGHYADSANRNGDVMMTSPPRLERLQLFDYPATPQTLARGSGVLTKDTIFNRWIYF